MAKKKISTEEKCDLCTSSICCTYITQEIDKPTCIYDFDTMLWQLRHHNVQFYKEEGSWYLKILNPCLSLQPDGRCGIYETRPMICREHENDYCEYDESTEDSADVFFGKPEDLEKFCRKKYKNWDKRYEKFEKKRAKKAEKKARKQAEKEARKAEKQALAAKAG